MFLRAAPWHTVALVFGINLWKSVQRGHRAGWTNPFWACQARLLGQWPPGRQRPQLPPEPSLVSHSRGLSTAGRASSAGSAATSAARVLPHHCLQQSTRGSRDGQGAQGLSGSCCPLPPFFLGTVDFAGAAGSPRWRWGEGGLGAGPSSWTGRASFSAETSRRLKGKQINRSPGKRCPGLRTRGRPEGGQMEPI